MTNPIRSGGQGFYTGPRHDMPGFPIVPRNAPPDYPPDLASYLRLYSREMVGMNPPKGFTHAEWDVNLPVPRMFATGRSYLHLGAGTLGDVDCGPFVTDMQRLEGAFSLGRHSTLGIFGDVGQPMGADPTLAFPSTGIAQVRTQWAQRAVNAYYASIGRSTRVGVDDRAGAQTLGAIRAVRLLWLATLPTPLPTSPRTVAMPTIVDLHHVTMPGNLYDALRVLPQVADPTPARPPTAAEDAAASPPVVDTAGSQGTNWGFIVLAATAAVLLRVWRPGW